MPSPNRQQLADLLMSAATALAVPETQELSPHLLALGVTVTNGRLTLGARAADNLPDTPTVTAAVGFDIAVWLGAPQHAPRFPGESMTERAAMRTRGRLGLSKTVRIWLGVPNRQRFDVIPVAAHHGLFLIPVHDYARRWEEVERVAR